MSHALPSLIKMHIAKDLGYGLILGVIPGVWFKYQIGKSIQKREQFYAAYDKNN
ncbi:hypothetical protein RB653_004704 [Dictyostelium firmibasis]|uniref:Cytochrome c oxidase polypeptide VIIe n=1 Tax=Dictyostelium firmibasis TaxID=79012 RepID=A0AAN7YSI2_9MYCE